MITATSSKHNHFCTFVPYNIAPDYLYYCIFTAQWIYWMQCRPVCGRHGGMTNDRVKLYLPPAQWGLWVNKFDGNNMQNVKGRRKWWRRRCFTSRNTNHQWGCQRHFPYWGSRVINVSPEKRWAYIRNSVCNTKWNVYRMTAGHSP